MNRNINQNVADAKTLGFIYRLQLRDAQLIRPLRIKCNRSTGFEEF